MGKKIGKKAAVSFDKPADLTPAGMVFAELQIIPRGNFYARCDSLGVSDDEIAAMNAAQLSQQRAQEIVSALNAALQHLSTRLPEGSC